MCLTTAQEEDRRAQVGDPGTDRVQDCLGPGNLDEGRSAAASSRYHLLLFWASLILGGFAVLAFAMTVLVLKDQPGGSVGLVSAHDLHHAFRLCFLSEL